MRILVVIIVLAALAAGGLWKAGFFESTATVDPNAGGTFTVRRGDLQVTLTERGTLKTRNAKEIRSMVDGRATIQWLVEEGSTVKGGDIVVELDKTETEQDVENLQSEIIQLESELKAAQTEERIQQDQNLTDIEKAELAHEVATSELEMLLDGDIPAEERRLDLAIQTAESELGIIQRRFKEMPTMLEKQFITEDQFEEEEIKLKKAEDSLATALQEKRLYHQYKKPLEIKQKESAVTEAERGVERARNQSEARLEQRRANVNEKDRRLNRHRAELAEDLANLEQMTIRAPADGVIFYGNPDQPWEAEEIKVGENTYRNRVLMTIPDSTEMSVIVDVHEADIRKVKEGMPAIVRSELQRGKAYEGEIDDIASVANAGNRRWGEQIRRFRVEIKLADEDLDLRPGTSASVDIQIGQLTNVLHVPQQAVHAKEGQYFCYVLKDGAIDKAPVKIGRSNDAFLEVVEGLSEGDDVLLYEPEPGRVGGAEPSEEDEASGDAPAGGERPGRGGRGERGGGRRPGPPQP